MKTAILALCLLLVANCSAGKINSLAKSVEAAQQENADVWAVLVAGSMSYYNYRHQADVCHAYQVLKAHGVPDERIIVMMYDDIATDSQNPTPGVLLNHPNGPNVYEGVPKDYTGEDVTPENFLKVLAANQGLKESGKKVLESGEADHVFIYFSDHGGPGLIAFPSSELSAKELNKGLTEMHEANRFKRLVIYIEACEAGSMFHKLLPDNINIYAVTASNEKESSYATYWDSERYAFLGDEFSVNWLEDSDAHPDLSKETLQQQFDIVKEKTSQSHVSLYGDKSIGGLAVSEFQGVRVAAGNAGTGIRQSGARQVFPSQDVPLLVAERRAAAEPENQVLKEKYESMVKAREFLDETRRHLASKLVQTFGFPEEIQDWKIALTQHDCYQTLRQTFDQYCFDLSTHPYALRSLFLLVNVCETLESTSDGVFGEQSVASFMAKECSEYVRDHPFKSIE